MASREDSGENWPCDNGNALYVYFKDGHSLRNNMADTQMRVVRRYVITAPK